MSHGAYVLDHSPTPRFELKTGHQYQDSNSKLYSTSQIIQAADFDCFFYSLYEVLLHEGTLHEGILQKLLRACQRFIIILPVLRLHQYL